MAVVKVKYTSSNNRIKAHLRYIIHRPGRDGEKLSRQLFSENYTTLDKKRAYELIDNAPKGTIFFKIMVSPDPKKEDSRRDLDLWNLTDKTMNRLKKLIGEERAKYFQFFATEHTGVIRHTHAIALVPGRLAKEDFRLLKDVLRETATQEARVERKVRDFAREHRRHLHRVPDSGHASAPPRVSHRLLSIGMAGGRARRIRTVRDPAHACDCGAKQPMVRLKSGKYWCRSCGQVQEQSQGLSL